MSGVSTDLKRGGSLYFALHRVDVARICGGAPAIAGGFAPPSPPPEAPPGSPGIVWALQSARVAEPPGGAVPISFVPVSSGNSPPWTFHADGRARLSAR
jgi:hypothetical protein